MGMNILTLLIPKQDVDVIDAGDTLRQAVSKMSFHHYQNIPVLSKQGHYLYSISSGDLLFYMAEHGINLIQAEEVPLELVPVFRPVIPLPITASLQEVRTSLLDQNYVPMVDDKGIFVGIITRKRFALAAMRLVEDE